MTAGRGNELPIIRGMQAKSHLFIREAAEGLQVLGSGEGIG